MTMDQQEVEEHLKPLLDRIVPLYEKGFLDRSQEDFWAARAAKTFCDANKIDRGIFSIYLFNLVNLKPGETKTISFPIDVDALKFWNQQMKYDAEPGKFNVFIGVDSARVNKGEFELQ